MPGILRIAFKLLVNDRAKFAALLVGITFAVFLIIEMTSLFSGILTRASATVLNTGAAGTYGTTKQYQRRTGMQSFIFRRLWFFAAAVVLFGLGGRAEQVKPAGRLDRRCENAVREMAARLSSAKTFTFRAYTCRQQFLSDGQRVEFSHNQRVFVRRPDHIAASIQGDEGDSEFTFDGRTVTLYNARDHVYGQTEIEGDLQKLFDTLATRYGMTLPLVDLVLPDPAKALLSRVSTCQDLGMGYVFDVKCLHLAFRQAGVDWEIWIQEGNDPLPRKLVITYKDAPGTPQYVAYLSDWNLAADSPDSRFTFHPPGGAKQVDFAVPASQVRPGGKGATK